MIHSRGYVLIRSWIYPDNSASLLIYDLIFTAHKQSQANNLIHPAQIQIGDCNHPCFEIGYSWYI